MYIRRDKVVYSQKVVFSIVIISEYDNYYHSTLEADFIFLVEAKLTSVVERMS